MFCPTASFGLEVPLNVEKVKDPRLDVVPNAHRVFSGLLLLDELGSILHYKVVLRYSPLSTILN